MKLNYLLSEIKDKIVSIKSSKTLILDDVDIQGLSINSKLVNKGYLFFCLAGSRYKGSDFIKEARQNGAQAVMVEEKVRLGLQKDIIVIRVRDIINCLGHISNKFYNYPASRLNMTAITGTNGKTTITYIIENILKNFKKQAGVVGTVNYRFGTRVFNTINTTPDILTMQNALSQMVRDKIKYLVMEVSSHALAQRRIEGLVFDQAVFTNLTQDHLDYHKTKKNYFDAKSKLFKEYLKKDGVAIINIDDVYGQRLVDLIKRKKSNRVITYGIKTKADINAENISLNNQGSYFAVKGLNHRIKINTNLIGLFNIYNALAGISACLVMGIPKDYIVKGLRSVYVPGRLEKINYNNHNINIFVDYAHTEDALRNVLLSLSEFKNNARLITVFGCGGDRDKDKRHKMGRMACELADFVILTSDNPRSEDPEGIISDIKSGIKKDNFLSIIDRKKAIEEAIDMAKIGDIILVAGKGHENYQIIKDKKFAFDDCLVIKDILSNKKPKICSN